jgi:hypothetical protein
MVDYTTQGSGIRREHIDGAVKAVALMEYKLKTLCTIDSSDAFTESYYRETNSDPTSPATATATFNIKGVPQLAPLPYAQVTETKVSSVILKYGLEGMVSWEVVQNSNVPMVARTIVRIGRGVAKAVDTAIEAAIAAATGNTVTISAGFCWDSATVANRDPVKDILDAIQMIRADNIDALNGNGYLVVNGTDYTNLITNTKVINNPTFKTADVVANGVVGQICGLKIMVSEVVTADKAYVVVAKEALTWKEAEPLTVQQIEDPGIKLTIRAWERGTVHTPSPNAIAIISNTRT